MAGEEFSSYAIVDKNSNFHIFKSSQDNKRVFKGDKGPNTGGMGAISPAMITNGIKDEIRLNLIEKAVRGIRDEEIEYVGMLYLGGMKTTEGPKVVEYNSRWGDPEAQVVMPGILNDYIDVIDAAINGTLTNLIIKEDNKTRVCTVGASRGYPEDYSAVKGKRILGLEDVMKMEGIQVFGAGIKVVDGKFFADGGRLFSIVSEGNNIVEAREIVNEAIIRVSMEGDTSEIKYLHYRPDIGLRDEERFRAAA